MDLVEFPTHGGTLTALAGGTAICKASQALRTVL